MSVRDQIIWYFENKEEIIQGQMLTKVFDNSLLKYVDELVTLHQKGEWEPKIMASGSPNWYIEFICYLKSVGVDV